MNQFIRIIEEQIKNDFFKNKVIIIYGPRQVGKTTLVKKIMKSSQVKTQYLNCDEPDLRLKLKGKTSTEIRQIIGDNKIVVLDEAQRIKDIGLILKLMVDNFNDVQVIATGSSSFELSNIISEPLTGRAYGYTLYPLCEKEILGKMSQIETQRLLESRLIYGNYPEVINQNDLSEKERILSFLKSHQLLVDVLKHENLKGSDLLYDLLRTLALQIGQEVSLLELSSLLGIDKNTVKKYLNILQRAFLIFPLGAFNRKLRKEISRKKKIYFTDLGIRNVLVNNFSPLALRNDVGHIWENYIISEKIKRNFYERIFANFYFYRTYDGQEVDLLEEKNGILTGYEIKWKKRNAKIPNSFVKNYPEAKIHFINKDNYLNFFLNSKK